MLPYSIAKQLKDAGFPQEGTYKIICHKHLLLWSHIRGLKRIMHKGHSVACESEVVHVPTLSELIDACEDTFGSLLKSKTNWLALSTSSLNATGETAPIAVANLWLSLNKSPKVEVTNPLK